MNESNGLTASDVALLTGSNNNNDGFGGGGWGGMIWLFAILALFGGWGNGGFGGNNGGGNGGGGNSGLGYDFPWILNGQNNINANTNGGFRDAMLNDGINSIRDGIGNLSTQLCGCCGDMQMALANGFAGVEQGANARQMANMQSIFGVQTALQNCCCENRENIADLKYTLASEECATRANSTQNTQSILNLVNSGIQSIKDQLCQDKIDAKNDEISQLRQEVLYARGQASQIAQNQTIVDNIYDRLNTCPVGTTPVYGRTPIFTCNSGCGCSGNTFIN